jgi:hypothetical protein
MVLVDSLVEWPETGIWSWATRLLCCSLILLLSHLHPQNNVVSTTFQTGKACFQLRSVPLICSVIIITLQIKAKHTDILTQWQNLVAVIKCLYCQMALW